VKSARSHGINVIPQINCLGHQSWSRNTGELLKHYPTLTKRQANILRTKELLPKLVSAKSRSEQVGFCFDR